MSDRRTKKGSGEKGERKPAGKPGGRTNPIVDGEEGAEDGLDNGDNGKKVLKTIVRQAKKGEAKQQELYLKYIDLFGRAGGDEEDEEVVYETEFVDDKDKED